MNDVFIISGSSPEEVKQELRSEDLQKTFFTDSLFIHVYKYAHYFYPFYFLLCRSARTTMKPNAEEDSVLLPDRNTKVVADEVANGEFGLVINGHSLVIFNRFTVFCRWPVYLVYTNEQ